MKVAVKKVVKEVLSLFPRDLIHIVAAFLLNHYGPFFAALLGISPLYGIQLFRMAEPTFRPLSLRDINRLLRIGFAKFLDKWSVPQFHNIDATIKELFQFSDGDKNSTLHVFTMLTCPEKGIQQLWRSKLEPQAIGYWFTMIVRDFHYHKFPKEKVFFHNHSQHEQTLKTFSCFTILMSFCPLIDIRYFLYGLVILALHPYPISVDDQYQYLKKQEQLFETLHSTHILVSSLLSAIHLKKKSGLDTTSKNLMSVVRQLTFPQETPTERKVRNMRLDLIKYFDFAYQFVIELLCQNPVQEESSMEFHPPNSTYRLS